MVFGPRSGPNGWRVHSKKRFRFGFILFVLHVFQYWNIVLLLVDICTAVNDTKPENLNLKKKKKKKEIKKSGFKLCFHEIFAKEKKDRRRFYSFQAICDTIFAE